MSSLILLNPMLLNNPIEDKAKVVKKTKKVKKLPKKKSTDQINNSIMCRICDQEKGDVPIFGNSVHPNIPEDILQFTGILIENCDGLSTHMCQTCLHLLNSCIVFREICQKTNKRLVEKAIKKEINISLDTNTKQEIEIEYDEYCQPEKQEDCTEDNNEDFLNGDSDCEQDDIKLASFTNLKKFKKIPKQEKDKTIEEKKKFLCDVCGKTALSNANLLAHLLIHEPIFPFKCDKCPYMGRTMDLLKVHQRTHLSEKPFKCPQCPKATTTASNLAKHVRHVHSTTKPYKCTYCDKAFSFQHDMKRHIKDIHLRQGTVECYICFKKFNTRKILRGHQWKVHKIKGERQGRLPSYLKWQMDMNGVDEQNENHNNTSIAETQPETEFIT